MAPGPGLLAASGLGARDHVDAPRRPDGRNGREHELRSWERHLALEDLDISNESQAGGEQMVDENSLDVVNYGPLAAGDATFHAGWTMHRGEENTSSAMREVMTVIYFPDGMRVATPENRRQARTSPAGCPVACREILPPAN